MEKPCERAEVIRETANIPDPKRPSRSCSSGGKQQQSRRDPGQSGHIKIRKRESQQASTGQRQEVAGAVFRFEAKFDHVLLESDAQSFDEMQKVSFRIVEEKDATSTAGGLDLLGEVDATVGEEVFGAIERFNTQGDMAPARELVV